MLLLYPPGLGVSVPYGSPVWSKLLIAVEEEGNYGSGRWKLPRVAQTGRCLPGRQSEEVKCNARTQILDGSSDLVMDRMSRSLAFPGIRTASGFLAEHWRWVGSPLLWRFNDSGSRTAGAWDPRASFAAADIRPGGSPRLAQTKSSR
jgi:hypothetical protein